MVSQNPDSGIHAELQDLRERIHRLEAEAAERGSREGEERFRHMVDAAPFMMWMSGPDGLCTFFNRPWLTFRGRTMEQEVGNGWVEGVHPDDVEQCVQTYLSSFSARKDFRMEYRLKRADGVYCKLVDTGVPRFLPDGGFAGYIGSCVLVEERIPRQNSSTTPLTEREQQVLTLVAEGKSTKEVAALLGISYKTADSHRSRIMEKLAVHETASLVRYAIRMGLVKP